MRAIRAGHVARTVLYDLFGTQRDSFWGLRNLTCRVTSTKENTKKQFWEDTFVNCNVCSFSLPSKTKSTGVFRNTINCSFVNLFVPHCPWNRLHAKIGGIKRTLVKLSWVIGRRIMNSRLKFLCSCFAACTRAAPQICLLLITNFASFSLPFYLFTYLFHNYELFRWNKTQRI